MNREEEILRYLGLAEKMHWHLLDFAIPEVEFAKQYVFEFYRPFMLEAIVQYTSFKQWDQLNDVIQREKEAIIGELDSCLTQATELDYDMDRYTVTAYVGANEYAAACFDRLKDYVDNFYDPELFERTNDDY